MHKIFFGALLLVLTTLFSCNEPDTVGLDVLPGSDTLQAEFLDTLTINLESQTEDSVRSDAGLARAVGAYSFLIGQYLDPVFGGSSASFYTQMIPSGSAPDLTGATYDSISLQLAYVSAYGDTNATQVFEVYEMNEALLDDSSYFSNKTFSLASQIGTSAAFSVNDIKDSITVDTASAKLAPRLRIKLDDIFGQRIFNNASTYLTSPTTFKENVKGFYFKPITPNAAVVTFRTNTTASRMTLYYRKPGNTTPDSIPFYFSTDDVQHLNSFSHDYSTATFNTAPGELIYVQGMAGKKAKITIPYLIALQSLGPIAISKAELVLYTEPNSTSVYTALPKLNLFALDVDGNLTLTPDQSRSSSVFGGSLIDGEYRFNIAQYVQQILYGKRTDYGLSLSATASYQYPNRTILAGPGYNGSPIYKMKLQITYTKLKP